MPYDLKRLHEMQWPGFLDSEGKMRMSDGVATLSFGKHKGDPISKVPKDYWDYILRSDFPSDFKLLAAACREGRFPG